ncbi:bpX6 domain-containing protein [Variovorax sp. UC74_104]|uniref:bpX6 domain-containing protein n=1 Tax=Variovorax sp. UC74_104 TaxID=3374555 RepID=UPI003756E97A
MPSLPEFLAMPAAQVRHPLLKGRQPVAGLWFPSGWFGTAERARRIVEAWHAGAQAFRFAEGDLLRFAAPVSLDCDEVIGWPLRREGQALCSAELDPAERAVLPPVDVWLVHGGEVQALRLAEAELLDPSLWLAPNPVLLDTFDCREILPEPVVLDADGRTLREVLGDAVPPASAAQTEFLQAMAERARREQALRQVDTGRGTSLGSGHHRRDGGSGISMRAVAWLVGIAAALFFARALFHGLEGSPTTSLPGTPARTHVASSQVDASGLWLSLIVFGLVAVLAWWGRVLNARDPRRAMGGRATETCAEAGRNANEAAHQATRHRAAESLPLAGLGGSPCDYLAVIPAAGPPAGCLPESHAQDVRRRRPQAGAAPRDSARRRR